MKEHRILHVDGDAFFAGCETALDPSLRGKPVYVGGGRQGDGIVIAANYEAKKFGLTTGMACFEARRLCPKGILIRPHYEEYRRISLEMFHLLQRYTPTLVPISIDEGFLDVTDIPRLFHCRDGVELMQRIKKEISDTLGLTISTGLASSRLLAKLATESGKPNGCVEVSSGEEKDFLHNVPVRKLVGIGERRAQALAALGVHAFGELARLPSILLRKRFGIFGTELWLLANGKLREQLVPTDQPRTMITSATTLPEDEPDYARALLLLQDQTERVVTTFFRENLKAYEMWLRIRFKDFSSVDRSIRFPAPQFEPAVINRVVEKFFWDAVGDHTLPIRQVSVSFWNFMSLNLQSDLFGDHSEFKRRRLYDARERIERRFGRGAVITARRALLEKVAPHLIKEKPKCPFIPPREMQERIFGVSDRALDAFPLPRTWGRSTSRAGKDLAETLQATPPTFF